jgi:hypothetical protein
MMAEDVKKPSDGQAFNFPMHSHAIVLEFSWTYHCRNAMNEELLAINGLEASIGVLWKHLI